MSQNLSSVSTFLLLCSKDWIQSQTLLDLWAVLLQCDHQVCKACHECLIYWRWPNSLLSKTPTKFHTLQKCRMYGFEKWHSSEGKKKDITIKVQLKMRRRMSTGTVMRMPFQSRGVNFVCLKVCNIVCLCDFNWVTQYIFNCVTLCVPCYVCLKVCNCFHVFLCDFNCVCFIVWKLQAVTSLSLWVSATSNDAMLASHKIFGQSCEILSFSSCPPEQCFLTPSSGLDAHWDFAQVWRRETCELSRNRRTKLAKFEHGFIPLGLSNWKENPKRRWDQQCLTLFGQFGL